MARQGGNTEKDLLLLDAMRTSRILVRWNESANTQANVGKRAAYRLDVGTRNPAIILSVSSPHAHGAEPMALVILRECAFCGRVGTVEFEDLQKSTLNDPAFDSFRAQDP